MPKQTPEAQQAVEILGQAFAALSKKLGHRLELRMYKGGRQMCIVTEENELVEASNGFGIKAWWTSPAEMLRELMLPDTYLFFHFSDPDSPLLEKDMKTMKFSKIFGKTIEEVKVKLDLE